MAIAPIPFTDGEASGLEQLSGAPPLMVNSMSDSGGARRARPGISVWPLFPGIFNPSPVDAMVVFGDYLVYATRDRALWAWLGPGLAIPLSDGTPGTLIDGGARPVLLATHTRVIAVGGGAPQKWEGTGLSARLGGSPPPLSFVTGLATRLVGCFDDPSGIFYWSGLGETPGHETWDALNFAEAEARPDPLIAIDTNANELFAFGAQTLQIFSPDPTAGFAPGRTLEIGLGAPRSVIKVDDMFAFLDNSRRFVLTDGRAFTDEQNVLSKPIESVLRGVTASDCWGFRMRTDRWDACAWMFPTDGRGLLWDRRAKTWSQWRGFGPFGYTAPQVTSALFWPERNVFLVGLASGQIAVLDAGAYSDLGDPLKVELVTGFQDRGSDNQKKCVAAKFVFKRGQTSPAPVVHISYRDAPGPWGSPDVFSLGAPGDYDPVLELRSLGTYRRRQWKLEYTSPAELSFVGAREEYLVLDN